MESLDSLPSCDIYRLVTGQMVSNCYFVVDRDTKKGVVIDPGDDAEYIIETITSLSIAPKAIFLTHGHFDHTMAALPVQKTFDLPLYLHHDDRFLLDRMEESARHFLGIGQVDPPANVTHGVTNKLALRIGNTALTALSTPGHTPGSVTIVVNRGEALFVGDVMFGGGSVGRTDFSYSDTATLKKSIQLILGFAGKTPLYPGHGEPTTVGAEKMYHRAT